MKSTTAFVEAVVDSIQIWNRQDDIEETHMDNIDQIAVNRFIYEDLINEWMDRLFNNGRIKFQSRPD